MPIDYFTSMYGVIVFQKILGDGISILFPDLSKKFTELGIESDFFSLQWFVCIFTSNLNEPVSHIFILNIILNNRYID